MVVYQEFGKVLEYEDGVYRYSDRGKWFEGDFRTVLGRLQRLRSDAMSDSRIKVTYKLQTDPFGEERKRQSAKNEYITLDRFIRELSNHNQRN